MIWDVIKAKGVWKDKIPELRERVKEYFDRRNKWQNQANAKRVRKKSKKVLDSLSDDSSAIR